MKKIIIPAAIILAAAVSCSKEYVASQLPVEEPEELMRIEISATKAATKSVLADAEGSSVHWSEGDEVSVFDTEQASISRRFSSTIDEKDRSTASFLGDVLRGTKSIRALYPYDADARISGDVITTTLPSTQQATPGSFANGAAMALASGTVDEHGFAKGMVFSNLCAVIAFKTPSYLSDARSVVIASKSGAAMAGTVSIDCATGAITSVSGSSSVTIGVTSLDSSSTFYAAIAPGTYDNGFTFTVTTQGGNTYTAQTTQTIQAVAGGIYMLGTVGLVLTGYTPAVTLTHSYSSGVLTGTNAVVSIPGLPAELASMASWTIQLKNSSNVLVRSLNTATGTMTVENGYTYLPQGTYYLTTSYSLNNNGSIKTRQLPDNSAVSPAPTVSVSLGGYTSYDCYKGTNGQSASAATANTKDGSSIYDLSVTVNIAPAILHDGKYTNSGSFKYDSGSDTSLSFPSGSRTHSIGNKTGQSWAKHTLDATFTFDGVTANATQRQLHVTGLPSVNNPPTSSTWTKVQGNVSWNSDNADLSSTLSEKPIIQSASFYIPENINVAASTKITRNNFWSNRHIIIKLASTTILDKELNKNATYEGTLNGTMTSGNNYFTVEYNYSVGGSIGSPHSYVYYFNILYR